MKTIPDTNSKSIPINAGGRRVIAPACNSAHLARNGNNGSPLVTRSRSPHLTRNASKKRQTGPRADTRHLAKFLPEFIKAVQAMTHDEVLAIVKSRPGYVLTTASGERHGVDPAFLLQHKFGISRRSAYRHLKNGTVPSAERRIGGDGKLYPAGVGGRSRTKVERELRLAWQALNRAARTADADGYNGGERALLATICKRAGEMLESWGDQ